MKEKLKKVFTNKEFWTTLIGFIGLLLSIALSYFTGFKDGVLLDNSVRTEIIEKTLDESKINKKRSIDYTGLEYEAFYNTSSEDTFFVDFDYMINEIVTGDTIESLYSILGTGQYPLFKVYYNVNAVQSYTTYFLKFESISWGYQLNCGMTTYNSSGVSQVTGYQVFTLYRYNSDGHYEINIKSSPFLILPSYQYDSTLSIYSLQVFDFGVGYFNLGSIPSSGGATDEDLEQAYQNGFDKGKSEGRIEGYNEGYQAGLENGFTEEDIYNSYLNGFDKGKSEGRIEGYNEGLQVGKEIGYQNRIDSVEDTEQKINSVWTILENAITSVLNVLSFEILPGIPLYICIGVPVLLAVLLWFIKMGQS